VISKLDAARRQLEAAIRLVAAIDDDLAIHTLTMAAHGILEPLIRGQDFYKLGLKPHLDSIGKPHIWDKANFLKHADRDPDGLLASFDPTDNDWRIGFCLLIYRVLSGELTPLMAAFHFWMIVRHPDQFSLEEEDDPAFEEAYREAIAFQRSQGRPADVVLLGVLIEQFKQGEIPLNADLRRRTRKQP